MSEEPDEAGLIVESGVFGVVNRLDVRNIGVNDKNSVHNDFDVRTDRDDFFVVPFAARFLSAGLGGHAAVDGAVLLPGRDPLVVFVNDLEFHAVIGGVKIGGGGANAQTVVAALIFRELEFETEDEVGVRFFRFKIAALFADEIAVFDRVAVDSALPDLGREFVSVEEELESEFFFLVGKLVQGLTFLSVDAGRERADARDKRRDEILFHYLIKYLVERVEVLGQEELLFKLLILIITQLSMHLRMIIWDFIKKNYLFVRN